MRSRLCIEVVTDPFGTGSAVNPTAVRAEVPLDPFLELAMCPL